MGAPLPRWLQVAPSESHQESQMKLDAQIPSSSRPSVGATVAPVAEPPGAEAPVAEAAVVETPIMEAPAEETLGAEAPVAPSSPPAPMETGGAGDGQSWAEQVEAGEEELFQRSRPAKRARSPSRRCEPKPRLPFPLQDSEGGSPPPCSCMSMQLRNQPPYTMWQVGQLCIYTLIYCHKRPHALETRLPA